jgi:uncharacterized protein with HEPN domain
MPRRDKKVYLEDIIKHCEELQRLRVDATNSVTFLSNNYYYRTAERCFQIIGEALYHLNNIDRNIAINEKTKIIALRHLITHDYDSIDYSRLWLYIETFLPNLLFETEQLLKEEINKTD